MGNTDERYDSIMKSALEEKDICEYYNNIYYNNI